MTKRVNTDGETIVVPVTADEVTVTTNLRCMSRTDVMQIVLSSCAGVLPFVATCVGSAYEDRPIVSTYHAVLAVLTIALAYITIGLVRDWRDGRLVQDDPNG